MPTLAQVDDLPILMVKPFLGVMAP
jgi:hypothetical protein